MHAATRWLTAILITIGLTCLTIPAPAHAEPDVPTGACAPPDYDCPPTPPLPCEEHLALLSGYILRWQTLVLDFSRQADAQELRADQAEADLAASRDTVAALRGDVTHWRTTAEQATADLDASKATIDKLQTKVARKNLTIKRLRDTIADLRDQLEGSSSQ